MAIPLTFGNHLKFGPNSSHNAKGRLTFLHQERERERAPEALLEARAATIERGLACAGVVAMMGGRTRARDDGGGFSATIPI